MRAATPRPRAAARAATAACSRRMLGQDIVLLRRDAQLGADIAAPQRIRKPGRLIVVCRPPRRSIGLRSPSPAALRAPAHPRTSLLACSIIATAPRFPLAEHEGSRMPSSRIPSVAPPQAFAVPPIVRRAHQRVAAARSPGREAGLTRASASPAVALKVEGRPARGPPAGPWPTLRCRGAAPGLGRGQRLVGFVEQPAAGASTPPFPRRRLRADDASMPGRDREHHAARTGIQLGSISAPRRRRSTRRGVGLLGLLDREDDGVHRRPHRLGEPRRPGRRRDDHADSRPARPGRWPGPRDDWLRVGARSAIGRPPRCRSSATCAPITSTASSRFVAHPPSSLSTKPAPHQHVLGV